jgi:hypothetical protein
MAAPVSFSRWFGRLFLGSDILSEGFESLSVWLDHGNGYMTSFAGVDVLYGAGFTCMCAGDDFALRAVSEFAGWLGFHLDGSIAFGS